MSISIENYVIRKRVGEKEAHKMIKNAGFDCVDYSFYWCDDLQLLDDNYLDKAKNAREYLDEIGLVCNQSHAPFDFNDSLEMNDSCKQYLDIKRAIEAAGVLGAKAIVVHAIKHAHNAGEEFLSYNEKFYKSLEETAEKSGIKIAVENLFASDSKTGFLGSLLGSPEVLSDFITNRLGTKNFCACIDLGHAALTGCEPYEFIDKMAKGVIGALHVQDNDYKADRHIPPFHGNLDWAKITESLKNYGYNGEINFEVVHYLNRFPTPFLPTALKFVADIGRYLETKVGLN